MSLRFTSSQALRAKLAAKIKFAWHNLRFARGEVAEWLMAADCKSALLRVRWFESSPLHQRQTCVSFGKTEWTDRRKCDVTRSCGGCERVSRVLACQFPDAGVVQW